MGRRGYALLAPVYLVALLSLVGCYEGWDDNRQSAANTPTVPVTLPSTPVSKVYAYALFQPVSMGADAVASTACFPLSGIGQFKSTEWADRIGAITTALAGIADTVVAAPVSVTAADCAQVAAIQAAAVDTAPWGSNPAPTATTSDKPYLHLKAAFWEGEPSLSPPAAVTARNWAAWVALANAGASAVSLHYFVISNPVNGYFTQWEAAEAGSSLDGTAIDTVDPTAAGTSARATTISQDTAALVTWLQQQSSSGLTEKP